MSTLLIQPYSQERTVQGVQSYLCRTCSRQFRETHAQQGYSAEGKDHC